MKTCIFRILIIFSIFILCVGNMKTVYADDVTGIAWDISISAKDGNNKIDLNESSYKDSGSSAPDITIKAKNSNIYTGSIITIKFNELEWCEDNDQKIYIDENKIEKNKVEAVVTKAGDVDKRGWIFGDDALVGAEVQIKCLQGFTSTKVPVTLQNPGAGKNRTINITIKDVKPIEEKLKNEYLHGSETYYEYDFSKTKNWTEVNSMAQEIMEGKYNFKKGQVSTKDSKANQAYEILRLQVLDNASEYTQYVGGDVGDKKIPKFSGSLGNSKWNLISKDSSEHMYERIFIVRQKVLRDVNGKKKNQEWKRLYHFIYFSTLNKGIILVSAPREDNQVEVKDENGKNLESKKSEEQMSGGAQKVDDGRQRTLTNILDFVQGEPRKDYQNFMDVLENREDYQPEDIDDDSAKKIENATSKVLTVISNIGIVVAVIILAAIGIKYMIGSVEEKAEYKKDLIPYVVGACMLFGITTLMKILMAIGDKIANV